MFLNSHDKRNAKPCKQSWYVILYQAQENVKEINTETWKLLYGKNIIVTENKHVIERIKLNRRLFTFNMPIIAIVAMLGFTMKPL